jgi:hypothetical protein
MNRTLEWILASIGAVICLIGATAIAGQQQQMNIPGESLWPLPGLVLAEWMLLGIVGFAGVASGRPNSLLVAWSACGGLIALMIMGAFSIGPLVLASAAPLGGAALIASLRRRHDVLRSLGFLVAGSLVNATLLAVIFVVGFSLR